MNDKIQGPCGPRGLRGPKGMDDGKPCPIERAFTYHPPKEGQINLYHRIRYEAHLLAEFIDDHCPENREKSIAITKLEEVVMWANASIARN